MGWAALNTRREIVAGAISSWNYRAIIKGNIYAQVSLVIWNRSSSKFTFFYLRHVIRSELHQIHFLKEIIIRMKAILTILITGMDAVSIDLKLDKHCHSWRPRASLFKSSIILNRSFICRPVTAISMSLDSRASPVTRDPNSTMRGFSLSN